MAAILNSAILDSPILHKTLTQTIQSDSNSFIPLICTTILVFLAITHTCQEWFPPFAQKNFTHSFWLNLMMAAILNSHVDDGRICHLVIFSQLHSKTIHSTWFCTKIQLQTHSFSLNLMMAAILNSAMLNSTTAILDSDPCYLLSIHWKTLSLHFALTLNQTNSIWLKLIPSHQLDDGSHLEFCHL